MHDRGEELRECNESQWEVFRIMVSFMFWGMVALIGATLMLVCIGFPILAGFLEEMSAISNADQPILTESMLEEGYNRSIMPNQAATAMVDPNYRTAALML